MVNLLETIFSFVYEALKVYAASDQGKADIVVILDAVEAAGIDVPFYEPSEQGESGEQGVSRNTGFVADYSETADDNTAHRAARVYPRGE